MVRVNCGGSPGIRRMGCGVAVGAAGVLWACGSAWASIQAQVVFDRGVGDLLNVVDQSRYAVSDDNHVAFARSNNVSATAQSIVVWQPGVAPRVVFDSTTQRINNLAVNSAGRVAYSISANAVSGNVEHAVRVALGDSSVTLTTTFGPVANVPLGVGGYSTDGRIGVSLNGATGSIYSENPAEPAVFVANQSGIEPGQINRILGVGVLDDGRSIVATARFSAPLSRIWSVTLPAGSPQAIIDAFDPTQGILNIQGYGYSSNGLVAAVGDRRVGGGRGIVYFDGASSSLLAPSLNGVALTNLGGDISINDSGDILFLASVAPLGTPLDLIAVQRGNLTIELIRAGDTLFGSTVRRLAISSAALNDAGRFAFYYELANGRSGYAFGVIPAPGVVGVLGLAGLVAARRRRD